jgi:hypothetical protein
MEKKWQLFKIKPFSYIEKNSRFLIDGQLTLYERQGNVWRC